MRSESVPSTVGAPVPGFDCPHAERCAGCPGHLHSYTQQLHHKRDTVERALHAYREIASVEVGEIVPGEPALGYRVRAKLVVGGQAIGLYAGGQENGAPHSVVDIPGCRVLRPRVAHCVAAIRARLPFKFPLLALDIREADAGVLLTWIVPPGTSHTELKRAAAELIADEPQILGVSVSERAESAPTVLGAAPKPLLGQAEAPHHLDAQGPFHHAVPGGFVQAHAGQATRLHHWVAERLKDARGSLEGCSVLELYAGAAALGLYLAARGAHVTAVDQYAPSLALARRAAEAQGLALVTQAVSAEEALERTFSERGRASAFDAVIVDPPRRGLSPQVRLELGRTACRWLVYVSCDPHTLARDLSHLLRLGLHVEHVTPIDMIPYSSSIETAVFLRRGGRPGPHILYRDEQLIALEKPPFLAVTSGGSRAPSLLGQARSLPGFEHAVPLHPGEALEPEASGVCWFVRREDQRQAFARAWAQRIESYSVLAQGILRAKGRLARATQRSSSEREPRPAIQQPGEVAPADARQITGTEYRRERVVGTHSLALVRTPGGGQRIPRLFKHIGHPVLGDGRFGNPSANRHFVERHGLDRCFMHCRSVEWAPYGEVLAVTSELAADLAHVLASLAGAEAQLPRTHMP